jgi:hypothetical protein
MNSSSNAALFFITSWSDLLPMTMATAGRACSHKKKAAARFLKFERRPYIFYAPFSFGKGPVPTLSR